MNLDLDFSGLFKVLIPLAGIGLIAVLAAVIWGIVYLVSHLRWIS